ncbi:MAG: hypothetical protein NC124_08925 [Clostridium sp.]|nr:hypothetical protein [Clostridium sp.]
MDRNIEEKDGIEKLLRQAYASERVPEEWNIRLRNQLVCRRSVKGDGVSLWWLPAVTATVLSGAAAVVFLLLYVLMNIGGASSWMPNLFQRISGTWLVIHLAALVLEIGISWIITLVGVWKGDLVSNARLF